MDRNRASTPRRTRSRISMHEDVPDWHDSCSCEAEPYWVEAMQDAQSDAADGAATGERDDTR
jgi:hypothetical protein